MNVKIFLLALLMLLASQVVIECSPIDFFSQFTDDGDRQLMKRFAEYLGSDYSDDTDVSSSYSSNGVQTRGVSARQEMCRLPMKRGLCRALLPRWRYDPVAKTCSEFKFGGCDGNANNFKTMDDCMAECSGV